MERNNIDADFRRFVDRGDAAALARVFDAVAPRLLLVAAHVSRDAAEAEDLVQTTFLHAIKDAQRWDGERSVGTWLASILRHRAIDRRRVAQGNDNAATERELDDRPGRERDPLDIVADSEVFDRLVAAVEGLEEPYRTTVHLRIVDGLEPIAIARALGRAPGTVRMQLVRGLEKLRAALPDPRVLTGAVVATLAATEGAKGLGQVRSEVLASVRPMPVAASGAVLRTSSSRAALLVAAVSFVTIGAAFVLQSAFETTAHRPTLAPHAPVASAAAHTSGPFLLADPSPLGSSRQTLATVQDEPLTPTSHVTGRVLHSDGTPAEARIEVHQEFQARELRRAHSEPLTTRTDGNGRFAVEIPAIGAYGGRVNIVVDDFPRLTYTLFADAFQRRFHETATLHDAGDIRLPDGGHVRGRLVDPELERLSGMDAVQLHLNFHYSTGNGGRLSLSMFGELEVDARDGSFDVGRIPKGSNAITVDGPGWSRRTNFGVGSDDVFVDIVYGGPSPDRAIGLFLATTFGIGDFDPGVFRLQRDGADVDAELRLDPMQHRDAYVDVEPGEYTLVVDDPRFALTTIEHVRTATTQVVELSGGATVDLHVRDASGARVETYVAKMRPVDNDHDNLAIPLEGTDVGRRRETLTDVDRYAGIPCVPQTWFVSADGLATEVVRVDGLVRGETRRVDVVLEAPRPLTGVVRSAGGAPVEGAQVRVRHVPADGRDPFLYNGVVQQVPSPEEFDHLHSARTNFDGTFSIDGLSEEEFVVEAKVSEWVRATSRPHRPGDRVEFVLPTSHVVEGRLVAPKGASFDELQVGVLADGDDLRLRFATGHSADRVDVPVHVEPDGSFVYRGAPDEPFQVYLAYPSITRRAFGLEQRSAAFLLGRVDPRSQSTRDLEYDVAALLPSRIEVHVLVDGEPLLRGKVLARPEDPGPRLRFGVVVDDIVDDGSATLLGLDAGTWTIQATDDATRWTVETEQPLAIGPGVLRVVTFDVTTATARVEFVNTARRSLEGLDLRVEKLRADGSTQSHVSVPVGADGACTCRLPLGHFRAQLSRFEKIEQGVYYEKSGPWVEFDWTESGPVPAVIELAEPQD